MITEIEAQKRAYETILLYRNGRSAEAWLHEKDTYTKVYAKESYAWLCYATTLGALRKIDTPNSYSVLLLLRASLVDPSTLPEPNYMIYSYMDMYDFEGLYSRYLHLVGATINRIDFSQEDVTDAELDLIISAPFEETSFGMSASFIKHIARSAASRARESRR